MKKYTFLIIVILLSLLSNASAQVNLTREMCRDLALENSKAIKIAQQQQLQATYNYRAFRAKYFPSLTAKGLGLYNQKKNQYAIEGGYLPTYTTGADGTLTPNTIKGMSQADGTPVFAEYAFLPEIGRAHV